MSKPIHLVVALLVVVICSPLSAAEPVAEQQTAANDIQVDVGGVKVSIDRETGRMRNLPTAEARRLQAEILRSFKLEASSTPYTHESGMTVIDHDDRDMHWYLGTVTPDGDVQFNCVSSLGEVTATLLQARTRPAAQKPAEKKERQ